MNEDRARELGIRPCMRWVASAAAGVDPTIMGIAPVPATNKALKKAGLAMDDMDLVELNEAFAVQALYFMDRMGLAWDDERVNPWGGAIAYGHPLAASAIGSARSGQLHAVADVGKREANQRRRLGRSSIPQRPLSLRRLGNAESLAADYSARQNKKETALAHRLPPPTGRRIPCVADPFLPARGV